jgi:hypothetical protein
MLDFPHENTINVNRTCLFISWINLPKSHPFVIVHIAVILTDSFGGNLESGLQTCQQCCQDLKYSAANNLLIKIIGAELFDCFFLNKAVLVSNSL